VLDVNNIDTQPLPLKDFTVTVKKGSYIQARCPSSRGRCRPSSPTRAAARRPTP
jgi:hypothetical protein